VPSILDRNVAPFDEAGLLQTLLERLREYWIDIGWKAAEITDHGYRPLLRPRRYRPCSRRAAEQRDELAPPDHSITSSARASNVGGTVRPSAFAVLRLIASSNVVGCTTGRSGCLAESCQHRL